jgi:cytochrome c-type biogenesis protein CcmH
MAVVLGVALVVGADGRSGPPTDAQRAHRIAAQVRCPTCRGLSAADSDAPAAQAIRDEVLRRVQAGQTDGEILGYLVSRYDTQILLEPRGKGIGALVWALPATAAVLAAGGLALAFVRWRARPGVRVSPADRALVEEAMSLSRTGPQPRPPRQGGAPAPPAP